MNTVWNGTIGGIFSAVLLLGLIIGIVGAALQDLLRLFMGM